MRRLRAIAESADVELVFVREGANHEIWMIGTERIVIPGHSAVNEHTAVGILRKAREVTTGDD